MSSKVVAKINPKLKKAVPKMSHDERLTLENSMKNEGWWAGFPATMAPDGDICDGMNRFEIAKKWKIKPHIVLNKSLTTFEAKKIFVLTNVLARRHFNRYWTGKLLLELLEIEKKVAEKRKLAGKKTFGQFGPKGKSTVIIAKKFKTLGATTLFKIEKIEASKKRDIIKKAEDGEISINSAYNKINMKDQPKNDPPLPKGVFNVVYIDPPWGYENKVTGGSQKSGARQVYATLTPAELKAKGLKWKKMFAKNSVMFMWAVTPLGKDCQEVLESYGYKYKAKMYWIKDTEEGEGKPGLGSWFRGNVEELLIGIRGNIKAFRMQKKNYVFAKPGKHSEKPEIFRNLVEEAVGKVVKSPKKLEMFGRKQSVGWTVYGLEALLK